MRKKIQDLIRGTFEYERPKLLVPEGKLQFQVLEDGVYRDSFPVTSSTEGAVRGLVTCSNPHMLCLTPQFDGTSANIEFEYTAGDQQEGITDRGQIVLVTNAGEYTVPFEAAVTRFFHPSSIGRIKTLNDFSNLAKLNWEEALTIFQSPQFPNIFPDEKTGLLYQGLCGGGMSSHEMEEFLIGIGKKERSFYEVDNPFKRVEPVCTPVQEVITVTKSQWGYADITVSCQASFVQLGKKRLQTYDFTGKRAKLDYVIDPRQMHAGWNYAKIEFHTPFQARVVQLCARKESEKKPQEGTRRGRQDRFLLLQKYTEYGLKRMSKRQWAKESLEILNRMLKRDPKDTWSYLFCCQVFLLSEAKAEAAETLERAKKLCRNSRTPAGAYFLYLASRINGDTQEQEKIFGHLQEVFDKHKKHPVLFWLMLHLDPAYEERTDWKYQAIKGYLSSGVASPVFYLEACRLLEAHPELLQGADEIEVRIFYWAARQQILTEEMMQAVLAGAVRMKGFHPRYFWLLGKCCRTLQTKEAVKVICTYLIKNNRFGEAYFPWFARGVDQELKIAGLYEAYIRSWHKKDGDIPAVVLTFFSGDVVLPAVLRARLYAYLTRNERRMKAYLKTNEVLIYDFALQELKKGHMSDDLAEIYRYIKKHVSRADWEKIGLDSGFVKKIVCPRYQFSRVVVYQSGSVYKQTAPLIRETAYLSISSETHQLLFEDSCGRRYFLKDGYRSNHMLPGERLIHEVQPVKTWKEEDTKASLLEALGDFEDTIHGMDARIREARQLGLDVIGYQEQLLVRMLFTETFVPGHVEYFRAVCSQSDTAQIRDAYVSYFSWRYLIFQEEVPEEVFEYLFYSFQNQRILNDCCEIALLKWLCEKLSLHEAEYRLLVMLLEKYLERGTYFPFYSRLRDKMKRKYLLHDMQFLWMCGSKERTVSVRILWEDRSDVKEQIFSVTEVFPGMYVQPVRIFADESLRYEFFEEPGAVLKEGTLTGTDLALEGRSRYALLNRTILAGEEEAFRTYAQMADLIPRLFQPL